MVGVLGLLVGYALLLGVIQLLIYRYYREGQRTGDDRPITTPTGVDVESEDSARRLGESGDLRRCPHCGAPNESDSVFTYCQACAGQLRR